MKCLGRIHTDVFHASALSLFMHFDITPTNLLVTLNLVISHVAKLIMDPLLCF